MELKSSINMFGLPLSSIKNLNLLDNLPSTNVTLNQTCTLQQLPPSAGPSSSVLVEKVVFFSLLILQAALLHPKFQHSSSARWTRLGLGPLTISWWLCYPFRLPEASANKNMYFAIMGVSMAMRAIEFTFARGPYHLRSLKHVKGEPVWETEVTSEESSETSNLGDLILWTLQLLSAQRGLRWSWGLRGKGNTYSFKQHAVEMIRILLLGVSSFLFILCSQDPIQKRANPLRVFLDLGVPNLPGLGVIARCLHASCVLFFLYSMIEMMSMLPVLFAYILYPLAQAIGLSPKLCEPLNPQNYPPHFTPLFNLSSLAHFWGKTWHQKFRRSFLFCGGTPAVSLAKFIGASANVQKICGTIAVFTVSALLHELPLYAVQQGRYRRNPRLFQTVPESFLFFFVQSFGVILEPFIIPLIPKRLGGGRLWTASFLILTSPLFINDLCHPDGFMSKYPPISKLSWSSILSTISSRIHH